MRLYSFLWKLTKLCLLFTGVALYHGLLSELSVGFTTEWTGQTLVSLLVTAVTHRVVQVPSRTRTTSWSSGSTVTTHPTVLKKRNTAVHTGGVRISCCSCIVILYHQYWSHVCNWIFFFFKNHNTWMWNNHLMYFSGVQMKILFVLKHTLNSVLTLFCDCVGTLPCTSIHSLVWQSSLVSNRMCDIPCHMCHTLASYCPHQVVW